MADVAKHAGVSLATASRVINGGSYSQAAEIVVFQAVCDLGYVRLRAKQHITLSDLNKQAKEISELRAKVKEQQRELSRLRAYCKLLGGNP